MARAISQDSANSSGNSTPSSAEVRQTLWRESKAHAQSVDSDSSLERQGSSSSIDANGCLRHSSSDRDFTESGWSAGMALATKDIECHLVEILNPRTKFDSNDCNITGLTFKSNGDLLVSDSANHKVKSLDVSTGQLKVECTVPNKQGSLKHPKGLCVLKSNQILVADAEDAKLKLFTQDGRYLASFGRDLIRPCDITVLENGNVLVTDEGCDKVFLYQNLSEKGIVDLTSEVNWKYDIGQPCGITAISGGQNFAFVDKGKNTIVVIDGSNGRLLDSYYREKPHSSEGACKSISLHLDTPTGIASEPQANSILISDRDNSRVIRLDLNTCSITREVIEPNIDLQVQGQGQQDMSKVKVKKPELLAVGPGGLLAVVDEDSHRVKIYRYMDYYRL